MLDDLFYGALMIGWTAIVHAGFMGVALWIFQDHLGHHRTHLGRSTMITLVVLWFFLAVVVEAWSWAVVYIWLGVFDDLETALYFSTVAFTTLGFGDIVLDQHYRLLGAFEAAAGMVIFGWTTAMVFSVVQSVYSHDEEETDEAGRPHHHYELVSTRPRPPHDLTPPRHHPKD